MSPWILRKTVKDHGQIFRKINYGGYNDNAAVANKKMRFVCSSTSAASVIRCVFICHHDRLLILKMDDDVDDDVGSAVGKEWHWTEKKAAAVVGCSGMLERESSAEILVTPAGCTTSKRSGLPLLQLLSKFWYGCPFILGLTTSHIHP